MQRRKRRAVIIGGSMSGLFAAALLRRIGWEQSAEDRAMWQRLQGPAR